MQPTMESGFSRADVHSFEKNPYSYLKNKDFVKIKQSGKIEVIEDHQLRVPIYSVSARVAFLHSEKSAALH